jgi:H+/gluconate symporter-like permease
VDLFIIAVSLILLMYFAYRGYSIILIAPLFAILASVTEFRSMPVYSEIFMTKAAEYFKTYFPIFLLGAVFAKIMEEGELASSIAAFISRSLGKEKAILAVLLGCGVLTYGGLSVFVVVFVMYPFAALLFREADIPKRLIPATLWMGIFTYAMVSIPGTPQIQNIIPTTFFGTSTWASPVMGAASAVVYFALAWSWITYRFKSLAKTGEGYGNHAKNEPEPLGEKEIPHWGLSLLPLIAVIVVNLYMSNPFNWSWAYSWDPAMLEPFKNLQLSLLSPSVQKIYAIWSLDIALFVGIVLAVIIGWGPIQQKGRMVHAFNAGAFSSLSAILNTASGYAFGSVIAKLSGFLVVKQALMKLNVGSGPLFSEVITTNTMAALTGSASGGMTIALGMLGNDWLSWAQSIGMSPDVLHRIICLASAGIDTVPHNGALVTVISVCGLTHRVSYYDVFILTLMKMLVPFLFIAFYSLFGMG